MKIAMIYDTIYPYVIGGGEKRIYEISKKLSKSHEIHLFGMKYWKGDNCTRFGNIYLHGVCNSIPLYNKNGERSLVQPLYFSFFLLKESFKYNFDIIDCQNFPYFPCFVSKIYSLIKGKPFVITWLEIWEDTWNKKSIIGYLGSFIEKLCFKLSNNNIVLLEEVGKKLNRNFTVFPVGIDLEKIKRVKPHKEKFEIIFVGRLIKEKRVDTLLKAIKGLKVKICIIGDGPEKSKLVELAYRLELQNISFKGFLDNDKEVYSYMKSSKILVLPSIREGFGIVILEALACGCKVITTNDSNNYARLLVDKSFICSADVDSLRKKIKYSLKNNYHNKINLKDYDINVVTSKIQEYYTRCIDEK